MSFFLYVIDELPSDVGIFWWVICLLALFLNNLGAFAADLHKLRDSLGSLEVVYKLPGGRKLLRANGIWPVR